MTDLTVPPRKRLSLRLPRLRRHGRIPFVQQMTAADCGAACLAMVLAHHGKVLDLEAVRCEVGGRRGGIDAYALREAAHRLGLIGRGVKIEEVADLELLRPASILHWSFNHFVVFEKWRGNGAWILDPAAGRRFVSTKELNASVTGVALEFDIAEHFESKRRKRRRVGRYLEPLLKERAALGRTLVTSIVIQVLALGVPLLTALVVDRIIPNAADNLLSILVVAAFGLALFQYFALALRSLLLVHLRTRVDAQLTLTFAEHLVSLPYRFFMERPVGDLLMRMNSNAAVREILTSATLSALLDGVVVLFYLLLIFVASPMMGVVVLLLAIARVTILLASWRAQRDLMSETLRAQADSRAFQVQLLSGIETLKAGGAELLGVDRWAGFFFRELNATIRRGRLDAFVRSLLDALGTLSPLVILLLGAKLVLGGSLSLGWMLALLALAQGFLVPLSTLIATGFQLPLLASYLDRIDEVREAEVEKSGHSRPAFIAGHFELEDATFRYHSQGPAVLRSVTLAIKPGELTAIVGRSGSGKSTLAALLAGLYSLVEGTLTIDDLSIRDLDLAWYRRQLGFVPQAPYLFAGSIRDNIAFNHPSLPSARVVEAARLAAIHDDIKAMAMGYDTPITPGGSSLSGGQRQRLALARALVHRPRIVILDEATSALDAATEQEIMRSIRRLGATAVVIAHRLSAVADADRIVVLEAGEVCGEGTHEELLASSAPYRGLMEEQMRGEIEDR